MADAAAAGKNIIGGITKLWPLFTAATMAAILIAPSGGMSMLGTIGGTAAEGVSQAVDVVTNAL
jgi:hypothetical protein